VVDALVRQVERHTDFKVESHRLELVGRCPRCQGLGARGWLLGTPQISGRGAPLHPIYLPLAPSP
jgi:hypothetical protein